VLVWVEMVGLALAKSQEVLAVQQELELEVASKSLAKLVIPVLVSRYHLELSSWQLLHLLLRGCLCPRLCRFRRELASNRGLLTRRGACALADSTWKTSLRRSRRRRLRLKIQVYKIESG